MERPILLTFKQLKKPIDIAKKKLMDIQNLTQNQDLTEIVYQGLFVLAVSSFEIMMSDILTYYLKNIPQKLESKEIKLSKEELLSDKTLEMHIEKVINSLSYKNLSEIIDYLVLRYFEWVTLLNNNHSQHKAGKP